MRTVDWHCDRCVGRGGASRKLDDDDSGEYVYVYVMQEPGPLPLPDHDRRDAVCCISTPRPCVLSRVKGSVPGCICLFLRLFRCEDDDEDSPSQDELHSLPSWFPLLSYFPIRVLCFWVRFSGGVTDICFCFLDDDDRELQREKAWSRIHLVPLLVAEGDRDTYRRSQAALAREREIMKDVKGWEVSVVVLCIFLSFFI